MSLRWSARTTQTASALGLSALLLASAMKHFRTPQFYYPVVPEYLCRQDEAGSRPNGPMAVMSREEWVASSGLLEATAAVGLLFPATRKVAADGVTAMFTIFLAGHIDALRRSYGPGGTQKQRRIHALRLPLQIPLIVWSWSLRK
ncbi:hypothetical protein ACIQC5_09210 [Paenarthrobacter sp. NPDC092416]|uniref:DoxX family protein n=1 Tax=Paenarthrobacter sp. NPDC092416 TaxID=3364386 RepID=UPI0038264F92